MKSKNSYLTKIFLIIVITSFIFVDFPRTAYGQSFGSMSDLQLSPSLSQGMVAYSMSAYHQMPSLSSDLYRSPSLSQSIFTPQANSMSAFHNLPTLQKNEPKNQWFLDWVDAFGSVPITTYPAVRVGTNKIDVWMIPHEWDIVTKGWSDYESLVWGNITPTTKSLISNWEFNKESYVDPFVCATCWWE
ncbi:MAG: hypothetical protein ACMUJM_20335 [bacterium]